MNRDDGAGLRPPKPFELGGGAAAWKLWMQQFNWYSIATNLSKKAPEIQVAVFMSTIGPEATTIYNSFNLSKDDEKNLEVIIQKFTSYFTPKTNVTYERYVFNKIVQKEGQPFDTFVTELKDKVKSCEYGELTDSLLIDKIVLGINLQTTREKLLAEPNLTMDKTIDICHAAEQVKAQLAELEPNTTVAIIKKTNKAKKKENVETFECQRCGTTHGRRACPAFNKSCTKCAKKGHFAKCCKSRVLIETLEDSTSSGEELFVSELSESKYKDKDWYEEVVLLPTNMQVKFKLDSGSQCNVITKSIANKLKAQVLPSTSKYLTSYSDHKLSVLGETYIETVVKNQHYKIKYHIIEEDRSLVLGRNTCVKLNLIKRVEAINSDDNIFEGMGCLKQYEYDIDLIENPKLPICPARKVPHIYRQQVKEELENMVKNKVITPVTEPTPAVSPMVVVRKNNKLKLCIDPSEINKNLKRRHYPLNTIEEIATRINGSQWYTLLDCKKGFWQLKVTPRTSKYLTFSTPFGRFSCLRMPFGLASAPEVFQQTMSSLLTGIPNTEVSMDDILIHNPTKEGLEVTTKQVLDKLKDAGLKLNPEKCMFNRQEVKFLGHILTGEGLKPDPEKIDTINKIKQPENLKELQRFLGLITYLSKFIKNLSDITNPLRCLLQKDTEWYWDTPQQEAFLKLKELLKNPPVLGYYDPKAPILLSVDASSYACGGVLIQKEKPVAYCAKAFTKTEQGYSQLEKEANAILVACKKFHTYIWGCKDLTIESDHKPLETIFKKPLVEAPPRIQRMLYQILPYNAKIMYKKGKELYVADTLSRDCRGLNSEEMNKEKIEICTIIPFSKSRKQELKEETEKDQELNELKEFIHKGWPTSIKEVPEDLKKYWYYREQLSVHNNLIFKNDRVMIPRSMVTLVLKHSHLSHKGINGTLRLARDSVYWPSMVTDITEYVKKCKICIKTQKDKPMEPILLQSTPERPWSTVASDLFHLRGKDYIVIVDAYSGFFDFQALPGLTSSEVIKSLKNWFATFGIPDVLRTDNGKQYDSYEFKTFAKEWQFEHKTSSPHFPRSNGLAERYVQEAKNLLRRCIEDNSDIQLALLHHRNTPRDNVASPVQRLMGRRTKTLLPINDKLLKPKIVQNVKKHLDAEKKKDMQTKENRK